MAGLAAAIPTFLLEQEYSREFEFEADAYALDWMRSSNVDTAHYARLLKRLSDEHGDLESWIRYLSTHPSTDERIRAVEGG